MCISDETLAGRGEDVQIRLPTATESAVPPYVTTLAADAASAFKPKLVQHSFQTCAHGFRNGHSVTPYNSVRLAGEVSPPGSIRR